MTSKVTEGWQNKRGKRACVKCEVSYFLQFLQLSKRMHLFFIHFHLGVSKNRYSTPKWMVKIMENPNKIGWFGGENPLFSGNTHLSSNLICRISQDRKWLNWLETFRHTNPSWIPTHPDRLIQNFHAIAIAASLKRQANPAKPQVIQ